MFEQTGMQDGKVIGEPMPTGHRPTFMPEFVRDSIELPPGEFGIPSERDAKPISTRALKAAGAASSSTDAQDASAAKLGRDASSRPAGCCTCPRSGRSTPRRTRS